MTRLVGLIGLFMIMACTHMTKKDRYYEFIKNRENKIKQQIKVGNVTAIATWIPMAYRIIDDSTNKNDSYDYFDVKFERKNDEMLAKEKLLYLDFDIQKNFILASEVDSIVPAICQKVQNGHSESYEYMLAFDTQDKKTRGDFTLVYKDEIFGIGTLAFLYKQVDLKKLIPLAVK